MIPIIFKVAVDYIIHLSDFFVQTKLAKFIMKVVWIRTKKVILIL